MKTLLTIITAVAMFAQPVMADQKPDRTNTKALQAGGATVAGAAAGAVTWAAVGSGGLVIGGGAVAVGAAPIIAVGAVVGLAGYGVYSVFNK